MIGLTATYLSWSAGIWAVGALIALRLFGTAVAVAWSVAAPASILAGLIGFWFVAPKLAGDSTRATRQIAFLPVVRMAAAVFFGWLSVVLVPTEAVQEFWLSLVAVYLATLAVESALLLQLLQKPSLQQTLPVGTDSPAGSKNTLGTA